MLPAATGLKNENDEDVFVTDEMVDRLLDEHILSEKQKQAKVETSTLTPEDKRRLRVRAKFDLFFLCFGILGNNRLSPNLHGHLCEHAQRTGTRRFHEYLMPRGTFKTTCLTIGHTIQLALPIDEKDLEHIGWWLNEPSDLQLGWPEKLGTDIRILLAHETHEGSARFLYAITNHFLTNPLLIGLFPEAIPSPRKQRINKWELELPRSISGNPEPTVDTLGVGGKSQGRHYNYVKLDDIFGDKARDSVAESDTIKQWFDNIQSFFSTFKEDKLDLIGTRYSFDDIYAHAEERYGNQLVRYTRKLEETNPETGEKEITFPEEFTPDSIEILKKNKKIYSSQYQNDPQEGDAGFGAYEKKYFYWHGLNEIIVFDGKERTTRHVRDFDIVVLIDPGVSKSGGLVVTGMDYLQNVYSLVALRLELKPPDLTELVFRTVIRWQPRAVAIESDLFASVFEHWWMAEMQRRGIRFHIEPVHTKKRDKDLRIAGLEPYFAGGQFIYNENQHDLDREIKTWGRSKDIHILDALAYGPEVWRPGFLPGTRGNYVVDSGPDDQERDVVTGYSVIE